MKTCFYFCSYKIFQPLNTDGQHLSFYKHRVKNSKYKNDQWNVEDFDMVDNLMLLIPTDNTVFESFEKAVEELAKKLLEK